MAAPDFWSNRDRAQADVEQVSRLRSLINPFQELQREIEDFRALQELAAEENDPAHRAEAEKEVITEHERLAQQREQVAKSIRGIGHAYHFVDLERGVRRNGPLIASDIQGHIDQIRTIAQHAGPCASLPYTHGNSVLPCVSTR